MASEILLVNPRRRRRRKTVAKRRAPVRRRKTARVRRRAVARNPAPRRAMRRVRRRVRRNPVGPLKGLMPQLQTAAGGALGGLTLSIALGYLPIPANLKAGALGYVTKGALAFGLGMLAKNFTRASTAARLTEGALTVVMYEAMKDGVQRFAPQIPLGMYISDPALGYYGSGWNPGDENLGIYLPNFSSVPDASVFDGVMGYDGENAGY